MVRPPGVGVVLPRIGARLDRVEAVAALVVGDAAAGAEEIRIERRVVLVGLVDVAPGGVRLPDLDQGVGHGAPVLVEHAAGHHDALAERLAVLGGVPGEVVIELAQGVVAVHGPGQLRERLLERHQRLGRPAQHGRAVRRKDQRRMTAPVACAVGRAHEDAPIGWRQRLAGIAGEGKPCVRAGERRLTDRSRRSCVAKAGGGSPLSSARRRAPGRNRPPAARCRSRPAPRPAELR